MTSELDLIKERASAGNALHGCTSDPCGSVVCQTARDRDELLTRLEQAEQAVRRVRELHSYGKLIYPNGDEEHYCTYDENAWPCETIRALDGDTRG